MTDNSKIDKYSFQPGAMSIIQMGEELIGHPSTAINELVKNSYDADAKKSKVYFQHSENTGHSFAIICDDGNGMDSSTLFGSWLQPSVSTKRTPGAKSEVYQRNLLGSKGIGRLAAMALGENVTVITKEENEKEYNWISVNREAFREEKLLSDIHFPGGIITDFLSLFYDKTLLRERISLYLEKEVKEESAEDKDALTDQILEKIIADNKDHIIKFLENAGLTSFNKGTLIVIERLDDAVLKILKKDFDQIELPDINTEPYKDTRFYKALATLITPLKFNSRIQQELLEKGIIKQEKVISGIENEFSIEYSTNLIPDQEDKIEWLPVIPIPVQSVYDYRVYGKVSEKGNVEGIMSFQRLEEDKHEISFNLAGKDIHEESNIQHKLFEDENNEGPGEYYFDIRVYDIGEKDNLEKLARSLNLNTGSQFKRAFKNFQGLRISKNGFGVKPYGEEVEDWIELSKARVQQPGKNVNTNQILGYVFFYSPDNDNLEEKTNREGFLENKAFQEVKDTMKAIFSELGKIRYNYRLLQGLGRIPNSKHDRPDFEEYLAKLYSMDATPALISYSTKFMKDVSTSMDNIEESLSFSERLASLGSGIELVYHEMAQPISGLRTTKSSLDLKKEKINPEVRNNFINDINHLNYATDILAELRKSLQPAIGRTRKKNFFLYTTFLKVCNLYKSDFDEHHISIKADERLKDYRINDLEYAFWIAFLNIINNAVYWLKKAEKGGEIRFLKEGEQLVISNSGPFLNEELIEHIFNYGVTTRSEKNATGLGLAFTQSILSRNNWDIQAENREDGPAFIIKKAEND
ncbi:ATP-binding protein [Sinomicrobium kalidii]|uniref:ATP-binding protein n=1 Tax=Sinomicrobium kalidii TaxID=2900738 RepID=UPI001E3B4D40|nr:sensor histidine kinase [Sinomicrobium kalidii]UGU17952.1 ATP-binding protein [Sinomicrobium kalidii]